VGASGQIAGMATMSEQIPTISLPLRGGSGGGVEIPQLGFGVFQVPPSDTAEAVEGALATGYRHIDTAAAYRNEAGVAEGLRASGLDRGGVFVTTKCWNDNQGYEEAKAALAASLKRLDSEYVDLYLIHWPVPAHDQYAVTWKAFVEAQAQGLARAIGVSNFQPAHLRRVIEETDVTPAINQVELHPYLQQPELRAEHERLGIVTEAWSPLAQGAVLGDPTIVEIARAHGKTPAQAVIRWHLQLGNVVIPKSVTPERIRENIDVFDFELSASEMDAIAALDRGERTGPDPDTFVRP
jgi:2,5-diketo-D-gluconate reductase A